jgi:hypothetical protein
MDASIVISIVAVIFSAISLYYVIAREKRVRGEHPDKTSNADGASRARAREYRRNPLVTRASA